MYHLCPFLVALSAALLWPVTPASTAYGVDFDDPVCETAITSADSLYIRGSFDDAVTLLEHCLDRQALAAEDEIPALLLIAKAHQRQDREMQARAVIGRILEIDPDYAVDPVQETPALRMLFEQARAELARREIAGTVEIAESQESEVPRDDARENRSVWRRWYVVGGGAILAGAAAVILSGGNGGGGQTGERWPVPPGRPGN